jgi:hypothetical protein
MSSELINRLYNVRKTILKMMLDRGYLVSASLQNQTLEDFTAFYSKENKY